MCTPAHPLVGFSTECKTNGEIFLRLLSTGPVGYELKILIRQVSACDSIEGLGSDGMTV